jgi:hypothetical protein
MARRFDAVVPKYGRTALPDVEWPPGSAGFLGQRFESRLDRIEVKYLK